MKTASNELLRHTVATIAYRFQKAVKNSGKDFGDFRIGKDARTPCEIINHMFELIKKTQTFITSYNFNFVVPSCDKLEVEIERFDFALIELDMVLKKNEVDAETSKRLLQGPLLDVVTHIGQIAMLSGLNGNKIPKEDYSAANIVNLVL